MKVLSVFLAGIIIASIFSTISYSADTTPPSIENVRAVPPSIVQGEELTIKCNVTDDGGINIVKAIIKYPDNSTVNMTMKKGKCNEYYYTAKYTIIGAYIYHIWANDTSGNSNVSSNHTFYVSEDIYPPTTTYYLDGKIGKNGWYVSNVTIQLQANDIGMGVANIYYMLNTYPWWTYCYPFSASREGINDLYYYSIDMVGNKENVKHTSFKIDKTAPITTCQLSGYKGSDGWYITNVTINLIPSDGVSGINKTFYKIDNQNWQEYTQSFKITTNGIHTISYYSIDNAGNVESNKSTSFKIDRIMPVVTILKPKQGYLYIEDREILPTVLGNTLIIGRITIDVDASNHESGINRVEFYVDNILQETVSQPPYAWQWNYLAIGTHLVKAVAYDNAGNSASDELVVKIFNI